jgi:proteasome lid subunit RPN8/RPN11
MELWNSNLVECLFGNFEQTVIGTPIWSEYKPQRLELSASDASNTSSRVPGDSHVKSEQTKAAPAEGTPNSASAANAGDSLNDTDMDVTDNGMDMDATDVLATESMSIPSNDYPSHEREPGLQSHSNDAIGFVAGGESSGSSAARDNDTVLAPAGDSAAHASSRMPATAPATDVSAPVDKNSSSAGGNLVCSEKTTALCQKLVRSDLDPHYLVEPHQYGVEGDLVEGKKQPFTIVAHPQVWLVTDVHSHMCNAEVIGLLAGQWDPDLRCMYVQSAFPCSSTERPDDDGSTDVELDPTSEFTVRETILRLGLQVVGWYHSHPRFRPDPSITDIFNQAQYQSIFRDEKTGDEPFVGLIVSTYDKSLPTYDALHQWFHVVPYTYENSRMKRELHVPVMLSVQQFTVGKDRSGNAGAGDKSASNRGDSSSEKSADDGLQRVKAAASKELESLLDVLMSIRFDRNKDGDGLADSKKDDNIAGEAVIKATEDVRPTRPGRKKPGNDDRSNDNNKQSHVPSFTEIQAATNRRFPHKNCPTPDQCACPPSADENESENADLYCEPVARSSRSASSSKRKQRVIESSEESSVGGSASASKSKRPQYSEAAERAVTSKRRSSRSSPQTEDVQSRDPPLELSAIPEESEAVQEKAQPQKRKRDHSEDETAPGSTEKVADTSGDASLAVVNGGEEESLGHNTSTNCSNSTVPDDDAMSIELDTFDRSEMPPISTEPDGMDDVGGNRSLEHSNGLDDAVAEDSAVRMIPIGFSGRGGPNHLGDVEIGDPQGGGDDDEDNDNNDLGGGPENGDNQPPKDESGGGSGRERAHEDSIEGMDTNDADRNPEDTLYPNNAADANIDSAGGAMSIESDPVSSGDTSDRTNVAEDASSGAAAPTTSDSTTSNASSMSLRIRSRKSTSSRYSKEIEDEEQQKATTETTRQKSAGANDTRNNRKKTGSKTEAVADAAEADVVAGERSSTRVRKERSVYSDDNFRDKYSADLPPSKVQKDGKPDAAPAKKTEGKPPTGPVPAVSKQSSSSKSTASSSSTETGKRKRDQTEQPPAEPAKSSSAGKSGTRTGTSSRDKKSGPEAPVPPVPKPERGDSRSRERRLPQHLDEEAEEARSPEKKQEKRSKTSASTSSSSSTSVKKSSSGGASNHSGDRNKSKGDKRKIDPPRESPVLSKSSHKSSSSSGNRSSSSSGNKQGTDVIKKTGDKDKSKRDRDDSKSDIQSTKSNNTNASGTSKSKGSSATSAANEFVALQTCTLLQILQSDGRAAELARNMICNAKPCIQFPMAMIILIVFYYSAHARRIDFNAKFKEFSRRQKTAESAKAALALFGFTEEESNAWAADFTELLGACWRESGVERKAKTTKATVAERKAIEEYDNKKSAESALCQYHRRLLAGDKLGGKSEDEIEEKIKEKIEDRTEDKPVKRSRGRPSAKSTESSRSASSLKDSQQDDTETKEAEEEISVVV